MDNPHGRSVEHGRVVERISSGRSVLVSGVMGVGKTELLRHAARHLRNSGTTVTEIRANAAASSIPFGALAGLIDPDERTAPAAQVAAATERLTRLAGSGPSVLFVDDAQHLDVASIAVVHRMVTGTDTVLMASLRDTDPAPAELRDLWRHADVDRLDLEPLDDAATRSLVADALAADADPADISSICERSAGNPLFVAELIRAFVDGTPTGLTPHLVDLVSQRIDALPASDQQQLAMVAIGEPLDADVGVLDLGIVARLEAAGLVRTEQSETSVVVRTAHPLHAEVIRTRQTPLERRALSEQLGAALLDQPIRRRGDALRVVTWLLDAGDRPPAGLAEAAALEAIGWLDTDVAERLATIAATDDRSASTLFVLGEIHRLSGRGQAAAEVWEEAFEIASTDDDIRRVALSLGQLYQLFLRRPGATLDVLKRALDRITDPAMRFGIESDIALNEWTGDRREAITEIEALLDDPDCGDESAWTALCNLLWTKATSLDLDGVEPHLARADEIEARLPADRDGELDLLHAIAANIAFCIDGPVAAIASADSFRATADDRGIASGITAFTRSQMEQITGALDESSASVNAALAAIDAFDTFNAGPMVCWHGSIVAHHRGDDELGARLLAEAERRSGGDAPWQDVWAPRAAAWSARSIDDLDAAVAAARLAGSGSVETSEIGWGGFCYHDAVAWGRARDVVDELARIRPHTSNVPMWEVVFDHAESAADDDATRLEQVARRFEAMGARWFAAAAWANRAKCLTDPIESCRAATRALTLSPVRGVHPDTAGLALSERRRAVGSATAAGSTSKQVAESLFLSTRTVDNHLREIYRRLGISGRDGLGEVFANGPVAGPTQRIE